MDERDKKVEALRAEGRRLDAEEDRLRARAAETRTRHDEEDARAAERGQMIAEMAEELPDDPWFTASQARLEALHQDALVKLSRAHEVEEADLAAEGKRIEARRDALADRMRAAVDDGRTL